MEGPAFLLIKFEYRQIFHIIGKILHERLHLRIEYGKGKD